MSTIKTDALGCLHALKSAYDPTDAICDLVDNSVDEAAKNVYIEINPSETKSRTKPIESIWLMDDGEGFNDVKGAFVLGESKKKITSNVPLIGQFGVGLMAATSCLGANLVVITRTAHVPGQEEGCGDTVTPPLTCATFDATCADLKLENELCPTEVERYHNLWKEKREACGLSAQGTGAILIIDGIEMQKYPTVQKFVNALKGNKKTMVPKLGAKYGNILATEHRLNIFLNGKQIEPHDPTHLGALGVKPAYMGPLKFGGKAYGTLTITELPEELRIYSDDIGVSLYMSDRLMHVDNKFFGMIKGKSSYSHAPVRASLRLTAQEWDQLFYVPAAKNSFILKVDEEAFRNTFEEKYYRLYIQPILDDYSVARERKKQQKADDDLKAWPPLIVAEAQSKFPVQLRKLAASLKTIDKRPLKSKGDVATYDVATGTLLLNSNNPLLINHEIFHAKKEARVRATIYGLLYAFATEAKYKPSVHELLSLNHSLTHVLA